MTDVGWRQEPPADHRAATPEDLLAAARAADRASAREMLRALCAVDAARFIAWPGPPPEADAVYSELLAAPAPSGDDGASRLLSLSVTARRAVLAATPEAGYDAAAEALAALPSGYPYKSAWLHWRDLFRTTGRAAAWQATRRRLAASLQAGGVPPSEVLPALLGRLDLRRWRTEERLAQRMRAELAEAVEVALPRLQGDTARRTYRAAAGRELVRLGAEEQGAELLFAAVDDLPRGGGARGSRLFSRPAPEAALWLRSCIARAAASPAANREALAHHAILTMSHLARRHRAEHLMAEALDPLPVRFARHDVMGHALLDGALAWLGCRNRWRGHEWFVTGLRHVHRQPAGPLAGEAALLAVQWVERSGERAALPSVLELARRLGGTASLEALAEAARVCWCFEEQEAAWEHLSGAFRLALSPRAESPTRALLACASTLLAWDLSGAGLRMMREALESGQPSALRLPAGPGGDTIDPRLAGDELRDLLREQPPRHEPAANAARILLRRGHHALATAAWSAASASIARLESESSRLRGAITLARQIAGGLDLELMADVDEAVVDEAARILERLRVDDPPR